MKYKHTIEIITKDLQDIEKLVNDFNNYSSVPAIELDLALSKLRNIYDLLLIFRDSEKELSSAPPEKPEPHFVKPADIATEQKIVTEAEESTSSLSSPGNSEDEEKEALTELVENPEQPSEDLLEEDKVEFTSVIPDKPDITETKTSPEKTKTESSDTSKESPVSPESRYEKKPQKPGSVLGEKFTTDKKYINEKLAEHSRHQDVKGKLQGTPISSIAGSIGINDKFYIIRELFNGNPETFRQTLEILDHSANFNEAHNYLTENFDWEMESEPAQQLLALIRRKFITRENE